MSEEAPTDPTTPPERARIEPSPPGRRTDGLPILYVIGFVVLAAALYYVYRHPTQPRGAEQQTAQVDALTKEAVARQQEYDILTKRLTALESKPAPAPVNLTPLESKVAALENRAPVDLGPLKAQVDALEKREPADLGPIKSQLASLEKQQTELAKTLSGKLDAVSQQTKADLDPVKSQLDALEKKQADAGNAASGKIEQVSQQVGTLQSKAESLGNQIDDVQKEAKQNTAALGSLKNQAQQFGQLQAANVALNAGQPLGEIEGAPPALAQFAHTAPPTESGLRLSFETAAEAARHASQPALTDNQNFVDRMWTRAQQAVTIRQGDNVIVGDPISGFLQSAREKLDAGDLAGAVKALDGLAGPARAAMSDWISRAQSLLNARAAIAQMAART